MKRLFTAALAAVTVLALAGCATGATAQTADEPEPVTIPALSELIPIDDPRSWEGPSTAILDDLSIDPMQDAAQISLPTTVTSYDLGGETQVEVTDASRVIAIDRAGSLAATVWALGLGDTLVARDAATTFPGTEELPVVTGAGHTINSENIIALAPTLIITDGSIGPRDVVEQLRDVGITVVSLSNEPSFVGAAALARDVAAVFGAQSAGEELAAQIGSDIDVAIAQIAEIAPTNPADRVRMLFLYVRGSAGVYYLFGEESGADALIEAVGGVDVAGELGWAGMRPMTDEAMAAADPDLILVMTHGLESAGGVEALIAEKPAIGITSAGQRQRFVDMDDAQVLSFGPRSGDVIRSLARAIYAPDLRVRS